MQILAREVVHWRQTTGVRVKIWPYHVQIVLPLESMASLESLEPTLAGSRYPSATNKGRSAGMSTAWSLKLLKSSEEGNLYTQNNKIWLANETRSEKFLFGFPINFYSAFQCKWKAQLSVGLDKKCILWILLKLFILFRCNGKLNCVVPVDTNTFQDACPGTFKYLEVHYACLNPHSQASTYQAHSFEVEPSSNLFLTSKSRHSWSINPAKGLSPIIMNLFHPFKTFKHLFFNLDPLGEPKFPREGKLKPSHLTRHLEHNHIASTSSPASQRVPITTPRSTSTTTATSSVAIETSTKPVESMDSTTTPTLITEDSNFTIPIVKNNSN